MARVHRRSGDPRPALVLQRGAAGDVGRRPRVPGVPADSGHGHGLPRDPVRRGVEAAAGPRGAQFLWKLPEGVRRGTGDAQQQGVRAAQRANGASRPPHGHEPDGDQDHDEPQVLRAVQQSRGGFAESAAGSRGGVHVRKASVTSGRHQRDLIGAHARSLPVPGAVRQHAEPDHLLRHPRAAALHGRLG